MIFNRFGCSLGAGPLIDTAPGRINITGSTITGNVAAADPTAARDNTNAKAANVSSSTTTPPVRPYPL